jgi:Domain of Unknown Function (DUF928)
MQRSQTLGIVLASMTLIWMGGGLEAFTPDRANAAPQVRKPYRKKAFRFIPPANGAPTKRFSAATRGQCDSGHPARVQPGQETRLIALVPEGQGIVTTVEAPAIAFYIPPTCAETMRFSLRETTTKKAYEILLSAPTSSGIISLKFSSLKDLPRLEIGQQYEWELTLIPDPRDASADLSVNGLIEREQSIPNADRSFWLETIAALLDARQAKPQQAELKAEWNNLMTLVGLETISDRPLISDFAMKSPLPK